LGRRLVPPELRGALKLGYHGIKGTIRVERRAEILEYHSWLGPEMLAQSDRDSRLADSRLATHQNDLAFSRSRSLPPLEQ
jgi:hypothetical protein